MTQHTTAPEAERRQYCRAPMDALAVITLGEGRGKRLLGAAVDISRSGVYIDCEERLALHTELKAHIQLRNGPILRVRAQVVRHGESGFGCRFTFVGQYSMWELQRYLRPFEPRPRTQWSMQQKLVEGARVVFGAVEASNASN